MHASLFSAKRRGFFLAVFFFLTITLVSAREGQKPVIFCSYNLKNWLQMQRSFGAEEQPPIPKPDKEKTKVIEFLNTIQPDILGVCEIGTLNDLKELQNRLKDVGIDLPHLEHSRGADLTRSLGLLSRYPITARKSQSRLHYQIGAQTFPMQRGILDVTVRLNDDLEVRFLGVHFKSKRAIPEADESLMRRNEAHLLREHLDQIFQYEPTAKVVCYGDFNEHRNEPSISEIIGSRARPGHMADLHIKDAQGQSWTHFWDVADIYARLDYFFLSSDLRPHINQKASYIHSAPDFDKASDHRPIVLTINPAKKSSRRQK